MKINYWKLVTAILVSLYFFRYALNPGAGYYIDNVNLIIHEAGHFVFAFLGQVMMFLGGSIFQVLVPFLFVGYFFLQGQFFSGALVMFWVGQNIMAVSVYAGDAQARALPLITGDPNTHDWHFLFEHFGVLAQTKAIAAVIYFIGLAVLILAGALAVRFSLSSKTPEIIF